MEKITKTMRKFLSLFLVLLILIQILPLQVFAESITDAIAHKEFIEDVLNNPASEDNNSDAEILYEVEEKRDEYTKVYKKSDGTYTAIMTEEPLHYLNNGVWEEINNTMSLSGNHYTNIDNLFNVEFPESIDSNENLTVEKDGYELSFSVDEIEDSSAVVENDIVVSDTNISVADEAISQTQSSVTYNDVAENTDLQYIVTPNSIKENIIVSDKESVKDTYTFTFETNGLNTEKLDDGSVVFKDENDEVKFRIPRPVMTDSGFAFSYDINVVLVENEDETITLEYSPSNDWTDNSDRVYPITIDPAITVDGEEPSFIEDAFVEYDRTKPNLAEQNHANDYLTIITNISTKDESGKSIKEIESKLYTKIDTNFFKNLGSNIVFTEVQYIIAGATSANGKLYANEILNDWNVQTVKYSDNINLSNDVIDYYTSPLSQGEEFDNFAYVHFNITKVFNEWFNGEDNNGFAITAAENTMSIMIINGGSQNTAIVLDYIDMGGYNENYSYHAQLAGKAGTGYVNDFTQRLSVIRDDIYVDDKTMPVTIGMIYDSATHDKLESLNYNSLLAYGNNWIPNYLRAYLIINENNFTYYTDTGSTIDFIRSTDNEGNVIFTELFSEIYGNQGYELEYYPESNGNNEYYEITRPDGCFEKFNEYGLLTSVTKIICDEQTTSNCVEKSISVTYDSNFRIDHITDSVGRKYVYEYENNLLTKVKCYSANGTEITVGTTGLPLEVSYNYDTNGNLTGVTHSNGELVVYTYENGNMTSITLVDSCHVEYIYDSYGRVINVMEESHHGTEIVNAPTVTYDRLNDTQIKITSGNKCEIYQFNNNGSLMYKLDSAQPIHSTLSRESNLVKDGGFQSGLQEWTTTGVSQTTPSTIIGQTVSAVELPGGTDTENIIYQTVSIDGKKNDTIAVSGWFKGNFTRSTTNNSWLKDVIKESVDSKICNFTNDRFAQIEVAYQYKVTDGNEEKIVEEKIAVPFSEHLDGWQYTSDGFILKGDCETITVFIRYSNNTSTGYFSSIELTKNDGYELNYDSNGQLLGMSLGLRDVISYTYNDKNGKISSVEYNNNSNQKTTTEFEYNDSNKLNQIIENDKTKYTFSYTNGVLSSISSADNRIIRYVDDFGGISSFNNSNFYSIKNEDGNPVEMFDDKKYETKLYDVDYNIYGTSTEKSEVLVENNKAIGISSTQDWYGRRSKNLVIAQDPVIDSNQDLVIIESTYGYDEENTEFNALNQVKTYTNKIYNGDQIKSLPNNKSFFYEYDENGNIIKEYDYDSKNSMELKYSYEYDEANQLIRYNDNISNRSYSYEYDDNGNLLFKSTYTYTPLETELGEPLSTEYYNATLTSLNDETLVWNGQQLESYEVTNDNNITTRVEYCYDENGLMTEKKVYVDNVLDETYYYTWAYGKLTNQVYIDKDTSTKHTIKYVYDSFNSVQGFILNHSETYLYLKNLYGDIVGIVDESGNVVVSYEYDVWGVPTVTPNDTENTLANIIKKLPLAYRGCFYDYYSGLYYVENRYYNPSIGRFINTNDEQDDGLSASNYSLFTYWENHPLWYSDYNANETFRAHSVANYLYNQQLTDELSDYYKDTNGFIFNQKATVIRDYRYGFNTVGPYGCGLVATYNALLLLENQTESQNIIPMEFHDVIREYEQSGLLAYGCFGLHPLAIAQFFIKRDYTVTITFNTDDFNYTAQNNSVNIMFYLYGTSNHYVAIEYEDEGFKGYNTFCEDTLTPDYLENSIATLVHDEDTYSGLMLISISKKQ